MVRRLSSSIALWLGLGACLSAPAVAGTTGSLAGTVTNPDGQALAGAKVTVSSPALIGGPRVTASGASGTFTSAALAPGVYQVTVELGGFVTQDIQEVRVLLDRTTNLDVTLSTGDLTDQVEVTANSLVVDTRRVGLADNFTTDYLENAAIGSDSRSFQAVLIHAPGTTDVSRDVADGVAAGAGANAAFNPLVFGSTVGENAYYVDGLENTDVVTGTFALNFNYDTIDEISFLKGGYEPEYGFASGGFVNLITKSGGNSFAGSLDVRYSDESFAESGDFFDPDQQESRVFRPSITVGGPAVTDQLWFFVSAESIDRESQPRFADATRDFEGEDYLAKLTWEAGHNWTLVAKLFGESTDIANVDTFENATPEARLTQEQKGTVAQVSVTGALGSRLLWDGAVGVQSGEINQLPPNGFSAPGRANAATGELSGNVRLASFDDRDRELLKTSLTWLADAAGAHEFKAGLELQDRSSERHVRSPGQGFFFIENILPNVTALAVNTDGRALEDSSSLGSLYAQDSWDLSGNVTLKAGLRWDQVEYENDAGREVADMDRLEPRIGLAWQITPGGTTVARASWGEFLNPAALYLPRIASSRPLLVTDGYFSCSDVFGPAVTRAACSALAAGALGFSGQTIGDPFGGDPNGWFLVSPAAPFVPARLASDLDPTFSRQLILSIERMLGASNLLELSYVNKDTEDIHESTCNGNLASPSAGARCDFLVVDNLNPLTREYEAASLALRSRVGGRANLLASYTWSQSRGSIEYTESNQSDFDVFPIGFVNRFGFLSDHRLHRVKLNGYVTLPHEFTLGAGGFWSSDFHWTPTDNGRVEYLDQRGARKGEPNYQLDLQVAKGWQMGRVSTQLIATVFNALDDERVQQVCQFENGCVLGGEPVSEGAPVGWQLPRRYELGVRFEFN